MISKDERPRAEPAYILDLTLSNVRCFGAEPQTLKLTDAAGRRHGR